ncbi:MAG TPA: TetR/AcrR family transcriptional regulator [Ktedonobacteraceae bacterium]|nr:TetR/AcrR family transcriptional regulator [Ktedonobacteraceae bacterium]
MQDQSTPSEARERVLDAAERLFARRGYAAVTLRDIAAEVGIRHTSLYHHVPGGKEELFMEVMERNFRRHQQGLTNAIAQAHPEVQAQLYAIADWLLSQPPMDIVRLNYSDLPSIEPAHALRLSEMALHTMILPIMETLAQAQRRGEIQNPDVGLVAGGLLGMIESLYAVPTEALVQSRQEMAHHLIDTFLNGLRRH